MTKTQTKMHSYQARLQLAGSRGRLTVQLAAVSAREAREQAAWMHPDTEVISVERCQYAIGISHREARREFLAR